MQITGEMQARRAHERKSSEEEAATRTSLGFLSIGTPHCSEQMSDVKGFCVNSWGTGSICRPRRTGEGAAQVR